MKTELCTRKTLQRRVPKINTAAKLSISKKNKKDWARGCSRKMFTPSSKVLKPLEKKKKKEKKGPGNDRCITGSTYIWKKMEVEL